MKHVSYGTYPLGYTAGMARHNELGVIGEQVATDYLGGLGWTIIARNYRRPYGEIDIVARETCGKLVFVEVKSVSYGTLIRAEENVHSHKLKRLSRTIESYLLSTHEKGDWRFDVVVVELDRATRKARIRHLDDVIIGS